jgi:HD superfamily phosphodiesterase
MAMDTGTERINQELVTALTTAMRTVFGEDSRRIRHALAVLEYACEIMDRERSVDCDVVVAAAILHDIGIQEAERKHGSSAGVYQEQEGPRIAEPIMRKLDMHEEAIEHVIRIIANHHSARDIDTTEFRILWDADWLVNMPEEYPDLTGASMSRKIQKIFRTKAGREKAHELFLAHRNS